MTNKKNNNPYPFVSKPQSDNPVEQARIAIIEEMAAELATKSHCLIDHKPCSIEMENIKVHQRDNKEGYLVEIRGCMIGQSHWSKLGIFINEKSETAYIFIKTEHECGCPDEISFREEKTGEDFWAYHEDLWDFICENSCYCG